MMASEMVGTVGKFISATHMGMMSNPSRGAGMALGERPIISTARASFPVRFRMEVKSYFKRNPSFWCENCKASIPQKGEGWEYPDGGGKSKKGGRCSAAYGEMCALRKWSCAIKQYNSLTAGSPIIPYLF